MRAREVIGRRRENRTDTRRVARRSFGRKENTEQRTEERNMVQDTNKNAENEWQQNEGKIDRQNIRAKAQEPIQMRMKIALGAKCKITILT